ncbi:MAG: hypothetical protein JRG79_06485 [Deltaproteobacteria bacterium]|nr:hypothetical protein [Deltaproteobacteria bacterium]MBW1943030.1 hypothetical protein [Deltaproteobacteria bacterium]MBW2206541.1 hypothetical protein [Deltaproteobacteria bacterium]
MEPALTEPCETREQCPDCDQCQQCSPSRCRLCKTGGHDQGASELGGIFTHGQYMEWRKKKQPTVKACCAAERREGQESCADNTEN